MAARSSAPSASAADQQDFTAELTQIKSLNPEVIYFGGLTPIGVRIRAQMDKLGINAVFDGTSGIVSDAYIQGLGQLAEGTLAFHRGRADREAARREVLHGEIHRTEYTKPSRGLWRLRLCRDGPDPRHDRRSGTRSPEGHRSLAKSQNRDSIIGKITFDDHGQNTVSLITQYVVQDGKLVVWEDSEYAAGKRKLPRQR